MTDRALGRLPEAESLMARVLESARRVLGPKHPDTFGAMINLGAVYREAGKPDRAGPLLDEAMEGSRRALGEGHPGALAAARNRALVHQDLGQLGAADRLLTDLVARQRRAPEPDHPRLAEALALLGANLLRQGRCAEAERALRESLALGDGTSSEDWHPSLARNLLGASLAGQARFEEAEPLLLAGYDGMKGREASIPAPSRDRLAEAGDRIIRLYDAWGRPARASEWRRRLGRDPAP